MLNGSIGISMSLTVCELIKAAQAFKPTEEDFKKLNERLEAFDKECAAKDWKPGEYTAWLNKPFSSL
jgi:hypothetical protein